MNNGALVKDGWVAWPAFDSSGRVVYGVGGGHSDMVVHRVSLQGGDEETLVRVPSRFEVVGDTLLFVRDGALFAQRIDDKLRQRGDAVPLAHDVYSFSSVNSAAFSASPAAIVYIGATVDSHLTWFDRSGRITGTIGPAGAGTSVRISGDAGKAVTLASDPRSGIRDLWICNIARGTSQRLTIGRFDHLDSVFSPDGATLAYSAAVNAPPHIFTMPSTGGEPTRITLPGTGNYVRDWTPDGRFIVYNGWSPATKGDIFLVPPQADSTPTAWLKTPFEEWNARVSPDGKWVAYASDESGRVEMYVAPFDKPLQHVQVSNDGGEVAAWRGDGGELYYATVDRKVYAVPIKSTPAFDAGPPQLLFADNGADWEALDVMPDGQRFLVGRVLSGPTTRPLRVLLNWHQLLERRPSS
jgi:dipeptidyl aminopeptidase/acylaminoacyl peptidase